MASICKRLYYMSYCVCIFCALGPSVDSLYSKIKEVVVFTHSYYSQKIAMYDLARMDDYLKDSICQAYPRINNVPWPEKRAQGSCIVEAGAWIYLMELDLEQ